MLEKIACSDLQIALFIVDKEGRQVEDTPVTYGIVVGTAVAVYLTAVHPLLQLTDDKKYTSSNERETFDGVVEQMVTVFAPDCEFALLEHSQSHGESLVQLADFVAGAANQQYNRENARYMEIIRERIVLEQMVTWTEIRAESVQILGK